MRVIFINLSHHVNLATVPMDEAFVEEIYDDVPRESPLSTSLPTNALSKFDSASQNGVVLTSMGAQGVKATLHPPDYTVLHFEGKKDSSSADSSVINATPLLPSLGQLAESSASHLPPQPHLPPPVPPHAVDHGTYEPVESPPERRFRSNASEHSNMSIESGY